MSDLNDFHTCKMSGGVSGDSGGGCLRPIIMTVMVIGLLSLSKL